MLAIGFIAPNTAMADPVKIEFGRLVENGDTYACDRERDGTDCCGGNETSVIGVGSWGSNRSQVSEKNSVINPVYEVVWVVGSLWLTKYKVPSPYDLRSLRCRI